MPIRIEHHSYIRLRLSIRRDRSQFDRARDAPLEIVDPDIEMDHHQLFAIDRRPDRPLVTIFVVKGQSHPAGGRTDPEPSLAVFDNGPTQQLRIEPSQPARIRR